MKGIRLILVAGIAIFVALVIVLFFWIKEQNSQDLESLANSYNLNPQQKKLLEMLTNSPNVRNSFDFDKFILTKPGDAVYALSVALKSKDYLIRREATFFLGQIDESFAVPVLLIAFKDKDNEVKKLAAGFLRDISIKIRPPRNKEIYEIFGFSKIRSELISALSDFINALQDKERKVRVAAAIILGNIGTEAAPAVPALITALQDEDGHLIECAADALATIGSPSVVPLLIPVLLYDKNRYVRFCTANVLGSLGSKAKSAIPALTSALQDKDEYIRIAAKEALRKIQESRTDKK